MGTEPSDSDSKCGENALLSYFPPSLLYSCPSRG